MTNTIVTSGTTVSNGTLGAGDTLTVNAGGSAISWFASGGQISDYGLVDGTTVEQGGVLTVSNGGSASATTISSGGAEFIVAGGTDTATTALNGGTFAVTSAFDSGLTVSNGGVAFINPDAAAFSATVASGGVLVASSGAFISALTLDNGGYVIEEPHAAVFLTSNSTGSIISTGVAIIQPTGSITTYSTITTGSTIGSGGNEIVLSGGIVNGGSVAAGGIQQIFKDGSVTDQVLNDSIQVVSNGGSASATVANSGAAEYVFSGGSATSTTLNSGFAFVNEQGSVTDLVVNNGGNLSLNGTATATTIGSGGSEDIYLDGTAVSTTISSGGYAYVYGTASASQVLSGAVEVVSGGLSGLNSAPNLGGVAIDETVASGGVLLAYSGQGSGAAGAVIQSATIENGGVEILFAGAADSGTTIEAGGTFIALPGASSSGLVSAVGATVVSSGIVLFNPPASIDWISGSGSLQPIISGWTITSGMSAYASDYVLSGGIEIDTTIGNKGYSEVDSGGIASNTTIEGGGTLSISSGGTASGSIDFSGSGGTLFLADSLSSGAIISGFAAGDTIDFANVSGGTVTLSGSVISVGNGATTETAQIANFSGSLVASPDGNGTAITVAGTTAASTLPLGNPTPVDIPLYVVPYQGGYKIGIEVSLDGGNTYRMYEFDTGGTGFYAAYSPSTWSSYTPVTTAPSRDIYLSGYTYSTQVVSTDVTFRTMTGGTLSVPNANVGLINFGEKVGGITPSDWNADLISTPPVAPLETNFYGDFGMSLSSGGGLSSVLSQIAGGLSNGFIINVGTYPNGAAGEIGSIQVGLTQADVTDFETNGMVTAMQGQNTLDPHPNSGMPSYSEVLAEGSLALTNSTITSNGTLVPYSVPSGFVYDTGAPTTTIHTGSVVNQGSVSSYLSTGPGITATATFSAPAAVTTPPSSPWNLGFQVGGNSGQNEVSSTASDVINEPSGYVNTGLNAFFGYRVMYDLADGLLGFEQISCFAAGTRIMTSRGEIAVEKLQIGDTVVTMDGRTLPIGWVGHRLVDCRRHPSPQAVWPVRVKAHSFGHGLPKRDLFLSPDHALFLEGVLIPVKCLLDGDAIAQVQRRSVTYYHIELDRHQVILAEGLPAETYLEIGARSAFENGGSILQAHPVFAPGGAEASLLWESRGYAALVVAGPVVDEIRRKLRRVQGGSEAA